jgi:hypothetical protein
MPMDLVLEELKLQALFPFVIAGTSNTRRNSLFYIHTLL